MGITATCDGCNKDIDDDVYCGTCSSAEGATHDVADDVTDLAAAIRRGDTSEAEYLLDKVAALMPGWDERVSVGRYSPRARA